METTKTRDYECISELLLVRQFKAPIEMRLHRRLLKEFLLYVWNLLLRNAFLKKEQTSTWQISHQKNVSKDTKMASNVLLTQYLAILIEKVIVVKS